MPCDYRTHEKRRQNEHTHLLNDIIVSPFLRPLVGRERRELSHARIVHLRKTGIGRLTEQIAEEMGIVCYVSSLVSEAVCFFESAEATENTNGYCSPLGESRLVANMPVLLRLDLTSRNTRSVVPANDSSQNAVPANRLAHVFENVMLGKTSKHAPLESALKTFTTFGVRRPGESN